jgi:WS/DGAT/MGAT family acyltransferase
VVEGVEDDRFAIIAKIHHCMIDGMSGVDLTTILLDVVPTADVETPVTWAPRPAPSPSQLAVAEAGRLTRRLVDGLSNLSEAVKEGVALTDRTLDKSAAALSSLRSGWLTTADRTPLNPDIGPNRRFDWTETPLEAVKRIKDEQGGSVNDVVLAITAGAIRRFLIEERAFDVTDVEFRAMNPVSTRGPGHKGVLGNQVAMWLIDLPIQEPDPLRRLEKVTAATRALKTTNQALGAATLVEISSGTPITLLSLANRLVGSRMRPFNMTVTNIPGPQFPMYLLESEMIANYPMVPLWAQHGLGIALFSYNGQLLWGIHADYDTLPDSDRFLVAIQESFRELREASQ